MVDGKPTTLLVGVNGAGKSTIRDVIEILQRIGRGPGVVEDLVVARDKTRWGHDHYIIIEVSVELAGQPLEYSVAFEVDPISQAVKIATERLSSNSWKIFDRQDVHLVTRLTEEHEVAFELDPKQLALSIIGPPQSHPIEEFRKWLRNILIVAPIPQLMNGISERGTLFPTADMENLSEWFRELIVQFPDSYANVTGFLQNYMGDLISIQNEQAGRETRRLQFVFGDPKSKEPFEFKELSDGEKCLMVAAMVVAHSARFQPTLCFWDEPESHIGISLLQRFISDLKRGSGKVGQLIATSQNAETIRTFSQENILILGRRDHRSRPVVTKASELKNKGDLADAFARGDFIGGPGV